MPEHVVPHSKIEEKVFRELMLTVGELSQDIGTVLVGKQAVTYGLMDAVGSIGEAIKKLQELIEAREVEEGGQ
mgnify:CR=1 FL=1